MLVDLGSLQGRTIPLKVHWYGMYSTRNGSEILTHMFGKTEQKQIIWHQFSQLTSTVYYYRIYGGFPTIGEPQNQSKPQVSIGFNTIMA